MKLNEQQQAIVDWVAFGSGSANVVARAGCGKTFVLVRGAIQTIVSRRLGEVALMAYNKSAADEFKERLAGLAEETGDRRFTDWRLVQAGTVHSFGFSAMRRWAQGVRVDGGKLAAIVEEMFEAGFAGRSGIWPAAVSRSGRVDTRWASPICKLVSLAKQSGFGALVGIDDRRAWYDLAAHHGIDEDLDGGDPAGDLDAVVEFSAVVLRESIRQDRDVIDFDDMVLGPLVHNLRLWQKDWVLIDEAQDTNAARRALALKMLKPRTGRLIAVGDDRQAIYGFTGADADSLDLIAAELGSVTLPLTITYRCPRAVVHAANRIVPDLVAHPSAPAGEVRRIPSLVPQKIEAPTFSDPEQVVDGQAVPWFEAEDLGPADVVLCRNVKPLVELAFELLAGGRACHVEGREIGDGLISLATRWKSIKTLDALAGRLELYRDREVQKHQAKGREDRAQAVEDRVDALLSIAGSLLRSGKTTVAELVAWIQGLFGDDPESRAVRLTSIHKSKGREWPRVFLLYPAETLPSKWARKPWQQNQEANLEYVAITRAQRELVFVDRSGG